MWQKMDNLGYLDQLSKVDNLGCHPENLTLHGIKFCSIVDQNKLSAQLYYYDQNCLPGHLMIRRLISCNQTWLHLMGPNLASSHGLASHGTKPGLFLANYRLPQA